MLRYLKLLTLLITITIAGCSSVSLHKIPQQNKLYHIDQLYQSALIEAYKNDLSGFAGLSCPSHIIPTDKSIQTKKGIELINKLLYNYPQPEVINNEIQRQAWIYLIKFLTIEGNYDEVVRISDRISELNSKDSHLILELSKWKEHARSAKNGKAINNNLLNSDNLLTLRSKIALYESSNKKIDLLKRLKKETWNAHEKKITQALLYINTNSDKLYDWSEDNRGYTDLLVIALPYLKEDIFVGYDKIFEFFNNHSDIYYNESTKQLLLIKLRDHYLADEKYYIAFSLHQLLKSYNSYNQDKDAYSNLYERLKSRINDIEYLFEADEIKRYRKLSTNHKKRYIKEMNVVDEKKKRTTTDIASIENNIYSSFIQKWNNVSNHDFWAMKSIDYNATSSPSKSITDDIIGMKETMINIRNKQFLEHHVIDNERYISILSDMRNFIHTSN